MPIMKCHCPGSCDAQVEFEPEYPGDDGGVRLCAACEDAGCDPFEFDPVHKRAPIACRALESEEDQPEPPPERQPCPHDYCVGEGHLMGVLGRLAHYRCRACGDDFNQFLDL